MKLLKSFHILFVSIVSLSLSTTVAFTQINLFNSSAQSDHFSTQNLSDSTLSASRGSNLNILNCFASLAHFIYDEAAILTNTSSQPSVLDNNDASDKSTIFYNANTDFMAKIDRSYYADATKNGYKY